MELVVGDDEVGNWALYIPNQLCEMTLWVIPPPLGGLPCIRGMRVTVSTVLGQLAASHTIEQVLADYLYLEHADVLAALEYAAAIAQEREVPLARPA